MKPAAVLLLVLWSHGFCHAADLHFPAADRYRAQYRALQSAPPGGLEALFVEIATLRREYFSAEEKISALSDVEFQKLECSLPGLLINREEIVFVQPDPEHFIKLAAKFGDETDQRFFAALKLTYPNGVWPAYIEQQTDYSGCTDYGKGKVVEVYRAWSLFRRQFPDRYAGHAAEELEEVSDELTTDTCACGEAASVEKELQDFVREFGSSPIRDQVAARLQAVEKQESDIRFHCHSG